MYESGYVQQPSKLQRLSIGGNCSGRLLIRQALVYFERAYLVRRIINSIKIKGVRDRTGHQGDHSFMPSIDTNKEVWDGEYQWPRRGDEWSDAWGGPNMQWYGSILPRIHRFLPSGRILEIACGYGRWTHYLKNACQELQVVDLSEECIEACKARFKDESNIEFHLNDGKSLEMIGDQSIDFIFSYDSLVHAEPSVLDSYISQFPRILKADGAAFIHHSNFGEYSARDSRLRKNRTVEMMLEKFNVLEPTHMRDPQVSAKLVQKLAGNHGLSCISQEIIPWGTRKMHLDSLTTLVSSRSALAGENQVFRNPDFMLEAANLKRLAQVY